MFRVLSGVMKVEEQIEMRRFYERLVSANDLNRFPPFGSIAPE
jgi:hypothetical protein